MLVMTVWFCAAGIVHAQSTDDLLPSRSLAVWSPLPSADSPAQQLVLVQRWTEDYEAWKTWFARWRSRPEPGILSARDRREPPLPPSWLGAACSLGTDEQGVMAAGCRAWREWVRADYASELVAQQVAQTRATHEAPHKIVWWEHIHLDALWPVTQVGSSAFGVCGVHATLNLTTRAQIFLAPGAILMRLPSIEGGQTWTPAADWGFSYRLLDLRLPAMARASTLHLNIARVWILGMNDLPIAGELYLAGFSLTFKSRPANPNAK